MAVTAPLGHQSKLSIDGTALTYLSSTVGKTKPHLEREGMRGTRSHDIDDVRDGPYSVGGRISMQPTLAEMDTLINLAMGGDTFAEELGDGVPIVIDKVGGVYTYAACKLDNLSISATSGDIVTCNVDVVGTSEAASGSVASPAELLPSVMSDLVLTLAGTALPVDSFELNVANFLQRQFMNTLVLPDADSIMETDRLVVLRCAPNANATNLGNLYDIAAPGLLGSTNTLVIADGTTTMTITLGKVQIPTAPIEIPGKSSPILMAFEAIIRGDGATKEFTISTA